LIGLGHDTVVFNTTVCCKKSIYLRFILTLRGSNSLKSAKYIFYMQKRLKPDVAKYEKFFTQEACCDK